MLMYERNVYAHAARLIKYGSKTRRHKFLALVGYQIDFAFLVLLAGSRSETVISREPGNTSRRRSAFGRIQSEIYDLRLMKKLAHVDHLIENLRSHSSCFVSNVEGPITANLAMIVR